MTIFRMRMLAGNKMFSSNSSKLLQISSKLNRPVRSGQLGSLGSLCRPGDEFDEKPFSTSTSTIDQRNTCRSSVQSSTNPAIDFKSVHEIRSIFRSKINSEISSTTKAVAFSSNFSQTVQLSCTQLNQVRRLSSSASPGNVDKSKDPFFEIDGLSKRKSRARSVFAWGLSATGAIGNTRYFNMGDLRAEQILKPFKIRYFNNMKVSNVAAGHGFTLVAAEANDTDHKLFGFGLNNYCQIGFHRDPKTREILKQLILPCPIALPLKKKEKIRDIACGRAHTIILTSENRLMSIGNNSFGQCGREPVEDEDYFRSYRVHSIGGIDEEVEKIICGQDHSLFLTKSGKLFACGWGADGQTGLGSYKTQGTPKQISGDLEGEKIVTVATTADAVLAANEKGELFGWGNSEYAQFRAVTEEMQLNVPRHLKYDSLKGKKIMDLACGGTTCAVLDVEGCVHVWGYGILGKGPKIDHLKEPSMLPRPLFGYNEVNDNVRVVKIEAGLGHFGAITNNGDFFMWGRNREGCLGLNQKQNQFFPLRVPLAAMVKKVSLGIDHTVALVTSIV